MHVSDEPIACAVQLYEAYLGSLVINVALFTPLIPGTMCGYVLIKSSLTIGLNIKKVIIKRPLTLRILNQGLST